ncbi:MAG: proton-conducting transporter membrane subunit [Bacteroidia bacterium]|nr:proton-conducting transporter membrane subunit [Bacteroidia bacterium]
MGTRWLLWLLFLGGIPLGFWVEEPLLRSAVHITSAIALYTSFYAKERYELYAILYLLSMGGVFLFVHGESLIWIFAGWELVSVAAWGLIVWGRGLRARALEVGLITFLINRLGDVFWLAALFGEGHYPEGFLIGGAIKAGLFPFSFWLVQAMYAPAPVSALLHSALLVSLGVYWLLRYPGWGEGLPTEVMRDVGWVSGLLAAIGAIGSRRPKVTLAWTTAAHLALILSEWPDEAMMRTLLLRHSYLKAALFLLIGVAQKTGYFSPIVGSLAIAATFLLGMGGIGSSTGAMIAEGITAVALGRMFRHVGFGRPEYTIRYLVLIGAVCLLGSFYFMEGLMGSMRIMNAWVGLAIGFGYIFPWRYAWSWRFDKDVAEAFYGLYESWIRLSFFIDRLDFYISKIVDFISYAFLLLASWVARLELFLIRVGWPYIAYNSRRALAWLVQYEQPLLYRQALRWGFLVALMGGFLWRYLH